MTANIPGKKLGTKDRGLRRWHQLGRGITYNKGLSSSALLGRGLWGVVMAQVGSVSYICLVVLVVDMEHLGYRSQATRF